MSLMGQRHNEKEYRIAWDLKCAPILCSITACVRERKKERKNRKLLLNWARLLFRLNTARFYRWLTPEVIFTEEFTDLLCHLSLRARWVSNETRWFGAALHHYGLIMMMSYRTHGWHHIAMVLTGQVKSLRGRKEAQMCPILSLIFF